MEVNMENLNINTGEIKLMINEDPERVIEFNPDDIGFINEFYNLISEFDKKEKEYIERTEEAAKNTEVDQYGIPKNTGDTLKILKDFCEYMRTQIDCIFGEGTSDTAFGTTNTIDMFAQFFEGITPYVEKKRREKISQYTNREQRRAMK